MASWHANYTALYIGAHTQRCSTLACEHRCGQCNKYTLTGMVFVPRAGGLQLCGRCMLALQRQAR